MKPPLQHLQITYRLTTGGLDVVTLAETTVSAEAVVISDEAMGDLATFGADMMATARRRLPVPAPKHNPEAENPFA